MNTTVTMGIDEYTALREELEYLRTMRTDLVANKDNREQLMFTNQHRWYGPRIQYIGKDEAMRRVIAELEKAQVMCIDYDHSTVVLKNKIKEFRKRTLLQRIWNR